MSKFANLFTKEYLTQKLCIEECYIAAIARQHKTTVTTVREYMKKYNISPKRNSRIIKNLTGKRYGRLVVVEQKENDKFKKTRWLCKCDCGNSVIVNAASLIRNLTRSCGCLRHDLSYKGYKNISGSYWNKCIYGATTRGLEFSITIEDAWQLYLRQNKKCAISGVPISFKTNNDQAVYQTASLDRIDSTRGYTLDNIQWVHKRVNRFKSIMDNNELFFWVKNIYKTNESTITKCVIDINQVFTWSGAATDVDKKD
jgi:hypothetical protein